MELTPTGVNNPGMRPHNEPPKSAHTWLKCLLVDRWQRDLGSRSLTGSAVLAVAFETRAPHGWRTLRTAEFQVVRQHDEYKAAASKALPHFGLPVAFGKNKWKISGNMGDGPGHTRPRPTEDEQKMWPD